MLRSLRFNALECNWFKGEVENIVVMH